MTAHLNWFSFLQEQDYDVWEYLFNNYLLPVIKKKASLKEIRYIENKRLMKFIKTRKHGYAGPYHCGRYFVRYNTLLKNNIQPCAPICEEQYFGFSRMMGGNGPSGWNTQRSYGAVVNSTKDQIMKHLEENEIKCRKSWTKEKMVKAMLSF
tara:strand:+ start:1181 stop:1633 length:453 start_codon:yes stop_codon:yes gene_type:complete